MTMALVGFLLMELIELISWLPSGPEVLILMLAGFAAFR